MTDSPKTSPICVHLHEADVQALDVEAKRLGLSRSGAVRLALTEWLAKAHLDIALVRRPRQPGAGIA